MEDYDPPSDSDDDDDEPLSKGKKKTKKKKKDPNAPKRGKSSFMFFSQEMRPKIKEENPDASFGELVSPRPTSGSWCRLCQCRLMLMWVKSCCWWQGKLVGERFKALTPEEKSKYEEMAAKDKKRYQNDMAEYKAKKQAEQDESDGVNEDQDDDSDDDSDSDSD